MEKVDLFRAVNQLGPGFVDDFLLARDTLEKIGITHETGPCLTCAYTDFSEVSNQRVSPKAASEKLKGVADGFRSAADLLVDLCNSHDPVIKILGPSQDEDETIRREQVTPFKLSARLRKHAQSLYQLVAGSAS